MGADVLEWQKTGKVNHLAKLSKVIDSSLDFLQAVADGVALNRDLEKRVAHGALKEKVIRHGAGGKANSSRKNGLMNIITAKTQK